MKHVTGCCALSVRVLQSLPYTFAQGIPPVISTVNLSRGASAPICTLNLVTIYGDKISNLRFEFWFECKHWIHVHIHWMEHVVCTLYMAQNTCMFSAFSLRFSHFAHNHTHNFTNHWQKLTSRSLYCAVFQKSRFWSCDISDGLKSHRNMARELSEGYTRLI